jgi:hypothetical protein
MKVCGQRHVQPLYPPVPMDNRLVPAINEQAFSFLSVWTINKSIVINFDITNRYVHVTQFYPYLIAWTAT